jgi:nicotinamidase-related amidase
MAIALDELVDPAHTALVFQEVQNGVVGDESTLPALAAAAVATGLVEHCAGLAHGARAAGVPVFHCTAETRADRKGANNNARLFAGARKSPVQLLPGSRAAQPVDAVGVDAGDVVLPRFQGLGPMAGSQLDPMLRNLGISTIVAAGVSVNVALLNLAFDAVNRGYQVVMPRDAIAGFPADYADAVIDNTLSLVCTIVPSESVIAAWQAAG